MKKTYTCPRCNAYMEHPPRDYNICPNRFCFVEFGYDAPEYNDDGTLLYPNVELLVEAIRSEEDEGSEK